MGFVRSAPGLSRWIRLTLLSAGITLALLTLPSRSSEIPIFARINVDQAKVHWKLQNTGADEGILDDWQALIENIRPLPERAKLKRVNAFVHRHLSYQLDEDLWQQEDYWATPVQTLSRGRGDCEDYVIIQYISLLSAGIPDEKLRLIYVRAQIGGPGSPLSRPHMVLGYYPTPGAQPIVLGSLMEDILPARDRTDLTPVFSFNSSELYAGDSGAYAGSATARLSPWRDVLNRMNNEGVSLNVSR